MLPQDNTAHSPSSRSKDPLRARKHLSANTLFHFTRTRDNLLGILRENFLPRYSLEAVAGASPPRRPLKHAVPMVCFCDIPLSQIRNHARDYGLFAIGLSKSWARKKGITPVLYVPNDSQTEISLITLFQRLQPLLAPQRNQTNLLAEEIIYLSLFVKRYEGWLERPGVPKRKVRFYDEREWRFVPPLDGRRTDDTPVVLEEAEFGNADMLRRANEAIAHKYPLSFRPEFINYVIVPEEKDILGIRDEILRIKAPFPDNDKKLLTTRILSMQHIIDDF